MGCKDPKILFEDWDLKLNIAVVENFTDGQD